MTYQTFKSADFVHVKTKNLHSYTNHTDITCTSHWSCANIVPVLTKNELCNSTEHSLRCLLKLSKFCPTISTASHFLHLCDKDEIIMMIQMLMMMIIVKMGMMMKKFMMMGIVRLEAASRQHRSSGPSVSGPSPDLWFRCHQHQQCWFNIIIIVFIFIIIIGIILIIVIIFTIANLYDKVISVQHKPAGSTSTSILTFQPGEQQGKEM